MRLVALTILGTLAAGASPAIAQDKPFRLQDALNAPPALKINGSFRARYENLDNAFRPGADPSDSLTSLRTLIFAEYDTGDWRIGGELQDSRAYGGKLGGAVSANDVNALEPIQAYIARDFKDPFGPNTSAMAQLGRMTLNLGSRRLVAADDYRNTTNGYTGLHVQAKGMGGLNVTAIYVVPQIRLPEDRPSVLDNEVQLDRDATNQVLWGGLVSKPVLPKGAILEGSFFGFDEEDEPGRATRDRELYSAGVRVIRNPSAGAFDYEAEYIRQWGSLRASLTPAAAELDVQAEFFHFDAGYTFKGPANLRVSFEYDYASGDEPGAEFNRFDFLFGMRRAELAPSGIYAAIGRTNLNAPGVRVEFAPSKRWDGFVTYKALWAASETDTLSTTALRPPAGVTDRFAAQQIDGRLRYWLSQDSTRLELNGVLLFDKSRWFDSVGRDATKYISIAVIQSF